MSMFCYQCQEALKNTGCNVKVGMCGKPEDVANLQDVLIFALKGIAVYDQKGKALGIERDPELGKFVFESLFMTITNANFDAKRFEDQIAKALEFRDALKAKVKTDAALPEAATWSASAVSDYYQKGEEVGVLSTKNEDVRSLRELLTYGIKGIAAYGETCAGVGRKK